MKILEKIKNLIFPPNFTCDLCGKEILEKKSKVLCDDCLKNLAYITHGCIKCGEKIEGEYDVCYGCKQNFREFDRVYSCFEYSGSAKKMVWSLKYDNKKYFAKTMASFLTDKIVQSDIKFDVLTYVPISNKTRKRRGYNQAMLLAKEVAKNLNLPQEENILYRVKENISQVELSAKERAENIKNSFIVNRKDLVKNKVVLVIDDVLTTGATMNEIAIMLKRAGAAKVIGLTFANTTRKVSFEKDNLQIATKSEN